MSGIEVIRYQDKINVSRTGKREPGAVLIVTYKLFAIIRTMMLRLNRPVQLQRAARWVLALFVLSVLNMGMQMPLHAAMQQAMQQTKHNALSINPSDAALQKPHCQMQASQVQDTVPVIPANTPGDDSCCCPPALCDAVEAQQDKLTQQGTSLQLFASLAFYPAHFVMQTDRVQVRGAVSLRYQDLHYRQTSRPPLSLNTVLLI